MPQDLGDSFRLADGKYLTAWNVGTSGQERLSGLDSGYVPVRFRRPYSVKHEFNRYPIPVIVKANGAGAATGTQADVNILSWPGFQLEYYIIGTQTIVYPQMVAGGFDIGQMDQTNGDGLEINPGLLGNGDMYFTTNSSAAFYCEFELKAGTAANVGTLFVGFRKVAANAQVYTSYTDYSGFLLNGGAIHTKTRKASGTAVDTDTTQTYADATYKKYKVLISSTGIVSYQIDGNTPTVVPSALTWTASTQVMPVIEFIQGASQSTLVFKSFSCGYQI